ncbi:MAG: hypothetical protein HYU36_14865 [Planctomycetes bacterium]|nr:hypothetical protein [Planctomycetota bacterium]
MKHTCPRRVPFKSRRSFLTLPAIVYLGLACLLNSGCRQPSRQGRPGDEEVYQTHCARCHDPYPPSHFDARFWPTFLKQHPEEKKERPPKNAVKTIERHLGL